MTTTVLALMRFLATCDPKALVSVDIGSAVRDIDLQKTLAMVNDSSVTLDASAPSWPERSTPKRRSTTWADKAATRARREVS